MFLKIDLRNVSKNRFMGPAILAAFHLKSGKSARLGQICQTWAELPENPPNRAELLVVGQICCCTVTWCRLNIKTFW